jgi:DNA-binding CsgD family transcriptional regulator
MEYTDIGESDHRGFLVSGTHAQPVGPPATTQLQKLAPPFAQRLGNGAALTPRELSVVRQLSLGYRAAKISSDLKLGEETIRSHIKKAQAKLDARNRVQTVAQAIMLRLIP